MYDTLPNNYNWSVKYFAESEDLVFISVLSFDETAEITASIYYEGKLIKSQTRQNYFSSCYVEAYLP